MSLVKGDCQVPSQDPHYSIAAHYTLSGKLTSYFEATQMKIAFMTWADAISSNEKTIAFHEPLPYGL
jgi:hypothetical protein